MEERFMDKFRESHLRWFGHVSRMTVGKKTMTVGKRKRGGPKRRWSDCTKEELNSIGAVGEDAKDRVGEKESPPVTSPRKTSCRKRILHYTDH